MKTCAVILIGTVLGLTNLSAGSLLVDRGLPAININKEAGANRANVAWAAGSVEGGISLVGDSFKNTSSSTYHIDTIRIWTVDGYESLALWGGVEGSSIGAVSSDFESSVVTYANGSSYGSSGRVINQIDFNVNVSLLAGETYDFFLNGTSATSAYVPYMHASNAALSGSNQEGADNQMLKMKVENGNSVGNAPTTWSSSEDGWDKASDVNVQVFGTVPDGGITWVMLLTGCSLLGLARRKLA